MYLPVLVVVSVTHVAAAHTVEMPGSGPHDARVVPSHFAWQAPVPGQVPCAAGAPEGTGVQ